MSVRGITIAIYSTHPSVDAVTIATLPPNRDAEFTPGACILLTPSP